MSSLKRLASWHFSYNSYSRRTTRACPLFRSPAALAHRPLRGRAGPTLLWSVAGFGICTIVFGVSRSLVLSLAALIFLGAADMVSVIIRATLVQLRTPDEMRGRVMAVDMVFIGTSNELGQFESGLTAQWLGTVPARCAAQQETANYLYYQASSGQQTRDPTRSSGSASADGTSFVTASFSAG